MTTVQDPTSVTPNVIYNKSGTTIQTYTLSPGVGTINAPYVSGHSIYVVTISGTPTTTDGIELPNSEIGDVIEVVLDGFSGQVFYVFPPSGEDINGFPNFPVTQRAKFIKVRSNTWLYA